LPIEKASKTNVWRWYFTTGGHPPYDPSKRYCPGRPGRSEHFLLGTAMSAHSRRRM
jgi:hypothetical protein